MNHKPNLPIAVIETKDNTHSLDGVGYCMVFESSVDEYSRLS